MHKFKDYWRYHHTTYYGKVYYESLLTGRIHHFPSYLIDTDFPPGVKEAEMLRKPQPDERAGWTGDMDPFFAKTAPTVWEYLTKETYDDGTKRQTATLSLFLGESGLGASLNDRDNERTMFISGESLTALLKALEKNLTEGKGDWRKNQPFGKRKGR